METQKLKKLFIVEYVLDIGWQMGHSALMMAQRETEDTLHCC